MQIAPAPPLAPSPGPIAEHAPARSRTGRRYGAELDGTTLRVIELVDDVVVSFTVYRSDTVARTVRQFLSTRPRGAITVAWHGTSTQTARLSFPAVPAPALGAALLEAAEHQLHVPAGSVVAGRILDTHDGVLEVVAASSDSTDLEDVWQAFRGTPSVVVPAPLVHVHDGLFLGLRNESADLTLVEHGRVVALRHLDTGGLGAVYRRLGPEPSTAFERVSAVVRGASQDDPEASRVVLRYVSDLGVEITRTTDFWTRQGLTVPSDVHAHGPGFLLPNLAGALMDAALFLKPVALPHASLDAISRVERPVGYVALLAGLCDVEHQPLLALVDPHLVEEERRQRQRDQHRRRLVLGAGTAAALALGAIGLLRLADARVADAEHRRDGLLAELESHRPALALQSRVDDATAAVGTAVAGDVAWSTLITAVLGAAPAPAEPVSLSLAREPSGDVRLDANADLPGDQGAAARYLQALTAAGVRAPWMPTLAMPQKDPTGTPRLRVGVTGAVTVHGRYEATRRAPGGGAPT